MGTPIKSITIAKQTGADDDGDENPTHTAFGVVKSVGEHYDDPGKVHVDVVHGRRKARSAKEKKMGVGAFDNRPTSSHTMPKAKAKHFPVGKRVKMTMMPMGDDDGDENC